jgi:hypothetical protein
MKSVIEYPSWHDDVRAEKASGKEVNYLADKYGVGRGRINQITTPNWQAYLVLWQSRTRSGGVSGAIAKLNTGQYEFKSVPVVPPAQAMQALRISNLKKRKAIPQEVDMSRERTFATEKKPVEGKVLVGAKIECYKCGATETYFNFKGSVTPEHLPKEFTRKGWMVGKNSSTDMCPSCLAKLRGRKPQPEGRDLKASTSPAHSIAKGIQDAIAKPVGIEILGDQRTRVEVPTQPFVPSFKFVGELPVDPAIDLTKPIYEQTVKEDAVTMPVVSEETVIKMDPNRTMTRADDRIIMLKLEEVYIDENTGYRADWTDNKVSHDLSVPVEWVAQIRDRSFGPETNADLRKKSMDELVAVGEAINRQILLADKKMEQMQLLDTKISDISERMAADVARFEELMKSLKTEDNRVEEIIKAFDAKVDQFKEMFAKLKA